LNASLVGLQLSDWSEQSPFSKHISPVEFMNATVLSVAFAIMNELPSFVVQVNCAKHDPFKTIFPSSPSHATLFPLLFLTKNLLVSSGMVVDVNT